MKTTKQKEIAINCLEQLDIYSPYIRKFKSKAGIPCFFENYAGFYADQEEELWNKIKEVENEYNCLIYAITHERVHGDDTWSMLCITDDAELEDSIFETRHGVYDVFAYVWNATTEYFSEFGSVGVVPAHGGIRRVY